VRGEDGKICHRGWTVFAGTRLFRVPAETVHPRLHIFLSLPNVSCKIRFLAYLLLFITFVYVCTNLILFPYAEKLTFTQTLFSKWRHSLENITSATWRRDVTNVAREYFLSPVNHAETLIRYARIIVSNLIIRHWFDQWPLNLYTFSWHFLLLFSKFPLSIFLFTLIKRSFNKSNNLNNYHV
jgi:hypothetical protein